MNPKLKFGLRPFNPSTTANVSELEVPNYAKSREDAGPELKSIVVGSSHKSITKVNPNSLSGREVLTKRGLYPIDFIDGGSYVVDMSFDAIEKDLSDASKLREVVTNILYSKYFNSSRNKYSPIYMEFLDRDGNAMIAIADDLLMQFPDTARPGTPYLKSTAIKSSKGNITEYLNEVSRRIQMEHKDIGGMGNVYLFKNPRHKNFAPVIKFFPEQSEFRLVLQEFEARGDGITSKVEYYIQGEPIVPDLKRGWMWNVHAEKHTLEMENKANEVKSYAELHKDDLEYSALIPLAELVIDDVNSIRASNNPVAPKSRMNNYIQLLEKERKIKVIKQKYDIDAYKMILDALKETKIESANEIISTHSAKLDAAINENKKGNLVSSLETDFNALVNSFDANDFAEVFYSNIVKEVSSVEQLLEESNKRYANVPEDVIGEELSNNIIQKLENAKSKISARDLKTYSEIYYLTNTVRKHLSEVDAKVREFIDKGMFLVETPEKEDMYEKETPVIAPAPEPVEIKTTIIAPVEEPAGKTEVEKTEQVISPEFEKAVRHFAGVLGTYTAVDDKMIKMAKDGAISQLGSMQADEKSRMIENLIQIGLFTETELQKYTD